MRSRPGQPLPCKWFKNMLISNIQSEGMASWAKQFKQQSFFVSPWPPLINPSTDLHTKYRHSHCWGDSGVSVSGLNSQTNNLKHVLWIPNMSHVAIGDIFAGQQSARLIQEFLGCSFVIVGMSSGLLWEFCMQSCQHVYACPAMTG